MPPAPAPSMVGYVEDVDEDIGSTIGVESTRRYARSAAARSPERERSNTGKPRMPESDSDDETASSSSSLSDSDSTPAPTRNRTRPVPVEHRRPLHKDRDHRRPPQDSRPPRDHRALGRDDRQRRERRPREDDDDRRRPRPQPKDRDLRDLREPRDPRDPRDLRDPRGPKKTRPGPPKHAASQPVVSQGAYRRGQFEDPAAYGVQQAQQLQQPAASGRPRAKSRPASYYAGQPPRPPLDMGWPGPHAPLPPPPGAFGMGNFPPPPHMFPGGPPMHPGMPPPQSPMGMGPPPFFDGPSPMGPPPPGEHLRHRFDGGGRPASAMGFGSPPEAIGYFNEKYDDYEEEQHQKVPRRSSRAKKAPPPLEERKKLPPSEFALKRTQSARPTSGAYKPPPAAREPPRESMREQMREPLREAPREHMRDHQLRERPLSRQGHQRPPPSHRRSVGFVDQQAFDEDDFLGGEVDLYQEVSPNQRRTALARPRRSSSVAYDQHGYDIVPAGNRGRRASMYGPGPGESGGVSLEEDGRYFDALRYQEDVSGGAPMPLTAETLRKASKRGELASSRSTRSSGSHDESDYKRSSHTTGLTTQSSAAHNNDDFTIKVSGQAVVKVPGAQIECDGGEITFSSNRGAGAGPGSGMHGASRAGSDKESTVYQLDDARSSRMDRKALPHRSRAASQSDAHSRIYAPIHAPIHAPYEHAPYEHVPYEHAPYEQAPYEPFEQYEQYEPVTYEHAPYDPSLAASNFY